MQNYTQDALRVAQNGIDGNSNVPTRRRSVDEMAVNYMLGTAMDESKTYEVLSVEEFHNLCEEQSRLKQRIAASKRRLAMEQKVYQTSHSLQRLVGTELPSSPQDTTSSKARSLLGLGPASSRQPPSRKASRDSVGDEELREALRRCEDLTREIWAMEKRQAYLQEQHARHNAAVLQLSYQQRMDAENRSPDDDFEDVGIRSIRNSMASLDGVLDRRKSSELSSEKVRGLNEAVYSIIHESGTRDDEFPAPSEDVSGVNYTENGLKLIRELQQGLRNEIGASHERGKSLGEASASTLLSGLWDTINQGENSLREAELNLKNYFGDELPEDLKYTTDERDGHGVFSVQAFSSKVQQVCDLAKALAAQQAALGEHLDTLKSGHQRALNDLQTSQGDTATLTQQLMDHRGQLEQLQETHRNVLSDLDSSQSNTLALTEQLQNHKDQLGQLDATHRSVVSDLEASHANAASLEQQLQGHRDELAELGVNLQAAQRGASSHAATAEEKSRQLQGLEERSAAHDTERQNLQAQIAHLQTEVTIARAELESAYGSRAERAAEANEEVKKELTTKVDILQKELRELIPEYERTVKQSVEAEKERETLETTVDSLRDRIEGLEARLSEQKVKTMGKSALQLPNAATQEVEKPADRGIGEGTSASIMRSEFKKIIKDMRTDHFKSLKVC